MSYVFPTWIVTFTLSIEILLFPAITGKYVFSNLSVPNCPFVSVPHVYIYPFFNIYAEFIVFIDPFDTYSTFVKFAVPSEFLTLLNTLIGDVVSPCPNCPDVFNPAAYTSLFLFIANEKLYPAPILVIFSISTFCPNSFCILAVTNTLLCVVLPWANWPDEFSPHNSTFPPFVNTILWLLPAFTSIMSLNFSAFVPFFISFKLYNVEASPFPAWP